MTESKEGTRKNIERAGRGMAAVLAMALAAGCTTKDGKIHLPSIEDTGSNNHLTPQCSKLVAKQRVPGSRTFDFTIEAQGEDVAGEVSWDYDTYDFGDHTHTNGDGSTTHSYQHAGSYTVKAAVVVDFAPGTPVHPRGGDTQPLPCPWVKVYVP